jgi:hypothetical protein
VINELLMFADPPDASAGLMVEIKTQQGDRTFTSGFVPAVNVFGNAHLNCCLPCPIMLYPNQTLIFNVANRTLFPPTDVKVRIVARGKKFLPYHNMALAQEMERCWSNIQTTPYWLSLEGQNEYGEVLLSSGDGSKASSVMHTPGGGFFELVHPRVQIVPDIAIGMTADQIDVEVTEGRVGRRAMDGPISLGGHYAVETKTVSGFPGNLFRAASACHCPPPTQLYRGNTRINHTFTNRNTLGGSSLIRLTYAGCMHYVSACPPQQDLDLVRRYGSGDANKLKKLQDRGDRVALSFLDNNPLYAEQETDCAPPSAQAEVEKPAPPPQAPPPPPPPEPDRIVTMHRPSKSYYGPGSTGALPYNYSWGVDQRGRTHLVIRDPRNNTFVRFASSREVAPFKPWLDQINAHSGLSGLGFMGGQAPKGEWETI